LDALTAFGPQYALLRIFWSARAAALSDETCLDEVFVKINGERIIFGVLVIMEVKC